MTERDEIEALRRENRALDEQIKLLVKTEQRLYHSQNELDRQLSRIRSLGEFALGSTGLESPDETLGRAVVLVRSSFQMDACRSVRLDVDPDGQRELREWIGARGPTVLRHARGLPDPLREMLKEDGTKGDPGIEVALCLPLRTSSGGLFGLLFAWKRRGTRSSYHVETVAEKHLPFLGLLANHLERAVQNSALASDLTDSNRQLSASLAKLERTQQQLLQARKMEAIGRLAGGIAHDFNNILTVIINHAELLRSTLGDGSPGLVDVERISQASERAATITQQLLAFSRKEPRQLEALDLNAITRSTAGMLERLIGERIALELELDDGIGPVRFDRGQLEQVLLNLVINARDAMPLGGVVRITTRAARPGDSDEHEQPLGAADYTALCVADTGDGMDDETRTHIFEPFFTTKDVGQGTGLGLSMVYGAVRQNHGHVRVSSQPGQGAVFTVLLPRADGAAARDDDDPKGLADEHGITVLLAEDEESVRYVAARILEQRGHRVIEAESGEAALEIALHGRDAIDVLVTDVLMPGISGAQLARTLRETSPELPVVYVSGYPFERLDMTALSANEEFLRKPFTGHSLASKVAKVLSAGERVVPG